MENKINIVSGDRHVDSRGTLEYINGFDMSQVKRMYRITQSNTDIIRGWRAHRLEQRWFYVIKGSFEMSLIKIDNFEIPDPNLEVKQYILSDQKTEILHVPTGYASAFRALEKNSSFMVYADTGIADAAKDDHQYPIDYFKKVKGVGQNG